MKFTAPQRRFSAMLVSLFLLLPACNSTTPDEAEDGQPVAQPKISVKILVLDDDRLGPVITRQFRSRRNGEAAITEMSWQAFAKGEFAAAASHDLVIYPAWRLGELASRDLLVPITPDNARLDANASRVLLFSDRNQAISWGGQQVAMSLGQSHWVMLYRSDVLQQLNAEPPETWDDFDKLADGMSGLPDDLPRRISIPLAGHWASYSLLVRAASAIRLPGRFSNYFDVSTMKPLIDTEPFLLSLQAWQQQAGSATSPQTPAQILQDYAAGKVAIAVVPVNRYWFNETGVEVLPPVTLSGIPGWKSVYDVSRDIWKEQLPGTLLPVPLTGSTGMLASALTGTDQQRNAIEVLSWMTDKQMSSVISVESPQTGLSRKVHLANPEQWLGPLPGPENATRFADYLNELDGGRRMLIALRIPAADRYLQALDEAVRQSVVDDANVVESLATAASRWSEIVSDEGPEAQKAAYRESSGLSQ
jgi:ABC-type glycerol-3-phosphate transport system substrate-binding protein